MLRRRARLLHAARDYFGRLDVLEVETPALSRTGATDPHLSNVRCSLALRSDETFYLHTSPEYAMKRLLAAGSPDIYQICKVFRDKELGARHHPEFTMIEWYRKDMGLHDMIDNTCALIATLYAADQAEKSDHEPVPVHRHHYRDLFRTTTGVDPLLGGLDELIHCANKLTPGVTPDFTRQLGDDRNAWLDYLMSRVVIPGLSRERLTVVHHYPASQAALARLDPDDERFAERFEIFFRGLELANGYRELANAEEQRRRFEDDRRQRAAAGDEDILPDNALLAALEHGLPDCCGVAIGFDRLMMSISRVSTINETISFSL